MRAASVAAGSLAAMASVVLWTTGWTRGFVGDAIVVVFLVAAGAALGVGTARTRLVGVALFAGAIEAFQSLGVIPRDAPRWVLWTIGATWDPTDLLAYAA